MRKYLRLWQIFKPAALFLLSLSFSTAVFAQSPSPQLPTPSTPVQDESTPTLPTPSVTRLLPDQFTVLPDVVEEVAPVYLDGRVVFDLSAPAVEGQNPAEVRAQQIQRRLNSLAREQLTTPERITITTDNPSNLPEIVVGDQRLLTVTNLDAQMSGHSSPSARAAYLAEEINAAFERYRLERQPSFLWQQAQLAVGIVVAVALSFWLLKRIDRRLKARQIRLANTQTQLGQATTQIKPPMLAGTINGQFDSVIELLKARLDNHQKRKINETLRGLVLLAQNVLWLGGLLLVLSLFPYSRWIPTLLTHWIRIPALLLLIAGIAYAAVRLGSLLIDKAGLALQESAQWSPNRPQRLSLRFSTFSQVAKGVVGAVIFAIMVLAMLTVVGIQVGPLLAGAGIAGLGVSLAAQGLIKDIINGFLILFEDQFGVGDVITIEHVTGSVENINLRITQIRNTEGCLISIPNNQIGIVQNHSKDWSQVDLSISVSPDANLTQALTLLQQIATALSEEPEWRRLILEPPELLGVEAVDHTGVALRLFLKTQPLKQWDVARELRKRVKHAFDEAGIAIAVPQAKRELHWEASAVLAEPKEAVVREGSDEKTTPV